MQVALFIPCYIDQLYPNVGIATLQLLEKLGCDVTFPLEQTCCGQPMANSGFASSSNGCDTNFVKNFSSFDYIVAPSGSCVLHVKEHLKDEAHPEKAVQIRKNIYELTEFLTDVLKVEKLQARFPYKVGLHNSCHGQRGLHLSSMTERILPQFSKPEQLLSMVKDIQLSKPKRSDECCGFGGTFCVSEEAVSVKMGKDRIAEHDHNDVDYITGGDTSCLMHLEGILRRQGSRVRTIHIAEILNSSL
ncbi:MAG: (Fe-S)-binding protein [Flavobacterium sp.]|jgi:L-lactate dehydrogenase complex protein LldE|uniref:(Fe-S)-binding protein n=1 Tax=Flavobacterium sp. TaxID=239 RepID=UPI001B5563B1|nr:(Fe-S)-binding protein [Flavobacterium sp.]MBP6145981.1 (Fe-S)-binding protein [Flavobacterium sp.]MBP7182346.1 (Fe-S)-binding protein [Flavobacterium sp.]MBP7316927.1 (Fe-S)-binding protein [Flavobacterium sp.]MBP8886715.1 (Fe-S)-binding protein [Flavobacterium sp.]HRL70532.1 (Fe-S)-binding protein [Flavobacterium sp.]